MYWFQNNPGQVYFCACVWFCAYSNAQMTPCCQIYDEPYAHKFCAVDIFSNITRQQGKITRCQVPSHLREWFNNSAGDIDFYQIILSQSESTIFYESMILNSTSTVSYTHLRAHETSLHLVCRLLLEKRGI